MEHGVRARMPEGSCRSVDREEWGELQIRGREAELEVGEAQGRAEGDVGLVGKEDLLRAEVEAERVVFGGRRREQSSIAAGEAGAERRGELGVVIAANEPAK